MFLSEQPLEIPVQIVDMLRKAGTKFAVFPSTVLYNEGWLLRLVLSAQADGIRCLPFPFMSGSRWFSEAQLGSAFRANSRADRLGETRTHVDGVVGHFKITATTKTGLDLMDNAKQFVVLEAKMFSPLSKGTRNADSYDQATRIVACMAETLQDHGKVSDLESVGFFVLAPSSQIEQGIFDEQMNRNNIAKKVEDRIETHIANGKKYGELRVWFQDVFNPLLGRLDLQTVPWESVIDKIAEHNIEQGNSTRLFYDRCLEYNYSVRN